MTRFIFVCYPHGSGGEQLAVKISKLPFCYTLAYTLRGKRTIAHDIFKSGMLSTFYKSNYDNYKIPTTSLLNVVPTHRSPDELDKKWPGSIYVVIEIPTDPEWVRKLIIRRYRYFALSQCTTWREAIGEYLDRGGNILEAKKLTVPIRNIDIHCLVKGIQSTLQTRKQLFLSHCNINRIKYKYNERIIPVSFQTVYENNLNNCYKRIEKLVK
jgi:hypothetical protein